MIVIVIVTFDLTFDLDYEMFVLYYYVVVIKTYVICLFCNIMRKEEDSEINVIVDIKNERE